MQQTSLIRVLPVIGLVITVVSFVALLPRAAEAEEEASAQRPNIVFIFTDDHATNAISAYGSEINQTPQLDRLAASGMLFENAFCTNSICAPSRAVILTGKHSHLNGVTDNGKRFDGSQQTFSKLLQNAGYETAIVGKWHLKTDPTGFDYWEVLPGQGQYYNPDFRTVEGRKRHTGYCTEVTTELALNWLKEKRDPDKPFMLMCQHKAPHRAWMPGPDELMLYEDETIPEPPTLFDDYATRGTAARDQEMSIANHMYIHYDLKCPPEDPDAEEPKGPDRWASGRLERMTPEQREKWLAAYTPRNEAFYRMMLNDRELTSWKYQRYIKDYLRCIAGVDKSVGQILDYLAESGLEDNTIVIYSSDQGFYLGEHGWYDKRFMYEPSLRMPLIVRWPDVTLAGSRNVDLVQNLDFAETFLDVAGVEVPGDMQGVSLAPLLRSEEVPGWRQSIYYEYFEKGTHNVAPHRGVRTDRFKLIHFHELDEWEFYDLERDPNELNNQYGNFQYATEIDMLRYELARLMEYYKVNPTKP